MNTKIMPKAFIFVLGFCILNISYGQKSTQKLECIHLINKSKIEVRLLIKRLDQNNNITRIYYSRSFKPDQYRNIEANPHDKIILAAQVVGDENAPVIVNKNCNFAAAQHVNFLISKKGENYQLNCVNNRTAKMKCE